MFESLFTPVKINQVEIKNRLALAPMFVAGLVAPDEGYSQRAIDYHEEMAKGGAGLIISGVTRVENEIEKMTFVCPRPTVFNLASFRELTEAVHYYDAGFFVQLTAGFGRNAPVTSGVKPVSASAIPHYFDPSVTCRELTIKEIQRIVKSFGNVAEILVSVGVDGIEIHGHEGYLLDQFATGIWNRRTEEYGGDLEGRLRFSIEILREIKGRVGIDFPVQYRFGVKHYLKAFDRGALPEEEFVELGRDVDESIEMAKLLEKSGYDALHIDAGGSYSSYYWAHPPMYMEHGVGLDSIARKLKEAVNIPVIICSRFDLATLAERVIEEGKADMIAMGRGLLADHYWPRKVWEGRTEEIRPCIACNSCLDRNETGGTFGCAVNPLAGRERVWELRPIVRQKEVMVAGGGVAGMEVSRVLVERGHRVSLYEKENELGGHLVEASVPDFKRDLGRLLDWYKRQLDNLEVDVTIGREVTPEFVCEKGPDAVVIATGSCPIVPELPGIKKSKVHTASDVLLGKSDVVGRVLIVGGSLTGCELALWLARRGTKVTIIEKLPELMPDAAGHANKDMLLDMLDYYGVEKRPNTALVEVTDEGAEVIEGNRGPKLLECDSVLLAIGFRSNDSLSSVLLDKSYTVYRIGDCKKPGLILNAVWDAYKIANSI